MKRNLYFLFAFSLFLPSQTVYSSSLLLNSSVQLKKNVRETQDSSTPEKENNKVPLAQSESLENALCKIISYFTRSSSMGRYFPKDVKDIINRYTISVFKNCEKEQWESDIVYRREEQRFSFAPFYQFERTIDAYTVDKVLYHVCGKGGLSLVIRHPHYIDVVLDRCNIASLKVFDGSLNKLTIRDSNIGSMEIRDVTFWDCLCFKRSRFNKFKVCARKHRGLTINKRKVIFEHCKIDYEFYFDSLGKDILYCNDYVVIASNAILAPNCKVTIGDNVAVLNFASRFINSPDFKESFKSHKITSCSYGCCFCMDSYCDLNIRMFNKFALKHYNYTICCDSCYASKRVKHNVNSCCNASLSCAVCSISAVCCPLLGLPMMCKELYELFS